MYRYILAKAGIRDLVNFKRRKLKFFRKLYLFNKNKIRKPFQIENRNLTKVIWTEKFHLFGHCNIGRKCSKNITEIRGNHIL